MAYEIEEFEALDWSKESRAESLNTMYSKVVEDVKNNIDWYTRNAKFKKNRAQFIRFFSLMLLGMGTVSPIFVDAFSLFGWGWITTVILAAGSGLLIFDRYMGYSTAWMRFLLTEMLLKTKLEAFQYSWVIDTATRKDAEITIEDLSNTLNRFSSFRTEVNKIIHDETQLWVQEFQANLKAMDENYKTMMEITRSGVIGLKIVGSENYPDGWDLYVDDKHIETSTGTSAIVKDVSPGFKKIELVGKDKDGNRTGKASDLITVTPGGQVSVTLTLPEPIKTDT